MKSASTDWMLRWRPILRACGPRDAEEGFFFFFFLSLKGDYVQTGGGELNNSRCVFCVCEKEPAKNHSFQKVQDLKMVDG